MSAANKHALAKHALDEKHASTIKHAFAYTADERGHLAALEELIFLDDGTWCDPAYWRHCAEVAEVTRQPEAALDCIERAEALECGMTHGGETL